MHIAVTQSDDLSPLQRVSDAEREAAVDRIRIAAGEGRLSIDDLGRRLETALAAQTLGDLDAVTRDLPGADQTRANSTWLPSVRLAVSHGHLERIGNWQVALRVNVELSSASAVLDFMTPILPVQGVEVYIHAVRSKILVLASPDLRVDLSQLGCHRSKIVQRGGHGSAGGGVGLRVLGDLRSSKLKVKYRTKTSSA